MLDQALDRIAEVVVTAPLWLQIPLVMVIVVPLAVAGAILLLRVIDQGAVWTRRARQSLHRRGE
ncbi:hypothetical protein CATRI_09380 [Corynebacterium atrinae]|uniref:hypothetical protein n=1 Tax=Corynebacterium atrinae TaxID=1336740 RepID=UPI0025B5E491|nr:hypothetical protein [Corynebacterium atrinae]WJY63944.1 hypothetical protein CATRI_09380 [Corynebacterium atrinae]